ncbi:ankyrin repeat-containing protein [Lasiodiplodia theobromae]|nr:ankyrin repeat-containing protein [Lasiodiplodia theobromae]
MFLVLDGLDELEKSEEVISLLQSFVQAGCKVCVMSRDTPDIRDSLSGAKHMEVRASREDMVTYAKARFQESDFCNVFEAHKHDGIIEEIVGKANGIFLLAKLFLDQLLDLDTIKQIRTALLLLPTNVMDAFQHSVARIEAQPAGQRELAYRLIGWITHSHRRLKADEIIHALALEEGVDEIDEENRPPLARLLKVCVGLVNHDAEDGTIGMIHDVLAVSQHSRDEVWAM